MTVALLAANVLIYLRPGALHEILPSIARVSFNPQLIIEVPHLAYPFRSVI
jgi:rhomboid domain-containing protein 1